MGAALLWSRDLATFSKVKPCPVYPELPLFRLGHHHVLHSPLAGS